MYVYICYSLVISIHVFYRDEPFSTKLFSAFPKTFQETFCVGGWQKPDKPRSNCIQYSQRHTVHDFELFKYFVHCDTLCIELYLVYDNTCIASVFGFDSFKTSGTTDVDNI